MFNLIFKDLLIQKKSIVFVFLYAAAAFYFFKNFTYGAFSVIVVAVVYIISQGAFWIDEKNHSDIMLNSLPINRRTVVNAKYISIYLYFFASVIIYVLAYYINDSVLHLVQTSPDFLRPEVFILGLFCAQIMSSISYPVYLKFGVTKSKIIMFVLFFAFFAFAGEIPKIINFGEITYIDSRSVFGLCLLIGIAIHYLSYLLSYNLYKEKDL